MADLVSCFGEKGVQVTDSAIAAQPSPCSHVSCLYQVDLLGSAHFISVTWRKNCSHGLSVVILPPPQTCDSGAGGKDNNNGQTALDCTCKVDARSWAFWWKRKKKTKGKKTVPCPSSSVRAEVFWDLSTARYGHSPEPIDGFFVAVVVEKEIVLLLGDLTEKAVSKALAKTSTKTLANKTPVKTLASLPNPPLVSRTEHTSVTKGVCATKMRLGGRVLDIAVEWAVGATAAPRKEAPLRVRVDGQVVLEVERLDWKFRGNQSVLVGDGLPPLDIVWDVYGWLFATKPKQAAFFMFSAPCDPQQLGSPMSPGAAEGSLGSPDAAEGPLTSPELAAGFTLCLHAWKID